MSTILDKFYIQVQLETEQLRKGLEDTQNKVAGLEKRFKGLSSSGDDVARSMQKVLDSISSMTLGFVSFRTLTAGTRGAIESVRELGKPDSITP